MKGFLQEYGNIMVVVAVVLGMLAFGKTGYAKSIQDAILGSADHIVETGENIVPKPVKASDTINIEGTEYVVLEQKENNQALIITASSIGEKKFQSNYDHNTKLRPDGQNASTYEGSEIDNYLENTWYKGLSAKMKAAIQTTNIKQVLYTVRNDPNSKQETGPNGQVYNTISRHVFLPGVEDINNVVNLKNVSKVQAFLNGTSIWTRDSHYRNEAEFLNSYLGSLTYTDVCNTVDMRPTFVIDLSQVDYKVAGHTDYK